MNKKSTRILLILFADVISVYLALAIGVFLRLDYNVPEELMATIFFNGVLIVLVLEIIMYFLKLHNSLWEYAGIDEAVKIFGACVISLITSLIFFYLIGFNLPRSSYPISGIFLFVFTVGIRFTYRLLRRIKVNRFLNKSDSVQRIVLIGGGYTAASTIKYLRESYKNNAIPVAIIEKDKDLKGSKIQGVNVEGNLDDLDFTIRKYKATVILLVVKSISNNDMSRILNIASINDCKIKKYSVISEHDAGKIVDIKAEDLLGREPVNLDIEAVSNNLENKTVLVSGGGGSIGSELCRQIIKFNPKQLIIFDIYENNAYEIEQELKRKYPEASIDVVIGSVRDAERLEEVFSFYMPNVVFHAAAHKHVPLMEFSPSEAIKNNVYGSLNMVRQAHESKVDKFVLISTDKAVRPTNIMGATKRIAEIIIQSYDKISDTEYVAVRFGNVLGSNGSVVPLFKKQIEDGGPVTVTHPDVNRYFMTIPEASQLVIQAGAMAKGGEIFILDMGEPVRIVDLAKDMIRVMGYEPERDIQIEFTGLRPGEKLYEELLLDGEIANTKHEKIFISFPKQWDYNEIEEKINKLNKCFHDVDSLKNAIRELVPEYTNGHCEDACIKEG